MLGEWLEVEDNAIKFQHHIRVMPVDIIPYLGHMADHCPSERGWYYLTQNWTWRDWGCYIKVQGRWAGGLEVSAFNMCLPLYGITVKLNVWMHAFSYLCENVLDTNTVLIMLYINHYTYLRRLA